MSGPYEALYRRVAAGELTAREALREVSRDLPVELLYLTEIACIAGIEFGRWAEHTEAAQRYVRNAGQRKSGARISELVRRAVALREAVGGQHQAAAALARTQMIEDGEITEEDALSVRRLAERVRGAWAAQDAARGGVNRVDAMIREFVERRQKI